MTTTLTGRFAIDRIEVPTFYTPIGRNDHDVVAGIQILAESSDHFSAEFVTLGFVSAQTPLGQGIYMGFPRDAIVEADPVAVLANLMHTHPYGRDYRPACMEAMNAEYHLVMSGGISNWTDDDPQGRESVLPVRRFEVTAYAHDALRRYNRIMRHWRSITRRQIKLIMADIETKVGPIIR